MARKLIGPTDPVPVYLAPAYGAGTRPWHLANLDLANPLFYDDTPTINEQSNVLEPLAAATFDGTSDVYCTTLGGPAVLVQTGIRGQQSWHAGPNAAALQIQTYGAPPVVPGMKSATMLGQGAGGGGTFFTFPAAGHIFAAHLSMAGETNSSASGSQFIYGRVYVNSPAGLAVAGPCELAFGGPLQIDSDNADPSYPGLPVSKNDQLILDPNGGTPLTNGVFHCSATVWYAIP